MSDWAQPFVEAGWTFDDETETVRSRGESGWYLTARIVIDVQRRYRVRLHTRDENGEHDRRYGFRNFEAISGDPQAYAAFVQSIIDWGPRLSKKTRGEFAKSLAGQVRRLGARMVWHKTPEKKVEL